MDEMQEYPNQKNTPLRLVRSVEEYHLSDERGRLATDLVRLARLVSIEDLRTRYCAAVVYARWQSDLPRLRVARMAYFGTPTPVRVTTGGWYDGRNTALDSQAMSGEQGPVTIHVSPTLDLPHRSVPAFPPDRDGRQGGDAEQTGLLDAAECLHGFRWRALVCISG